jgi:nicotinic acid mononucleotide adenylyltransferase|tara:strand:- start:560 stop:4540 length:3981 start_codon:yes stop_codon:yes gene_type:complete
MKDFKTLLNEVPAKKMVIGFGRFNPPTTGHELLINKVTQYARSKGSPSKIYVTATEDKKKNPLKQERKIYYMKRMFGVNAPFVPTKSPNQRTIIEVAKYLNTKEKITELTLIAGSDRIAEYKRLLNQYNGKDYNFDKITVLSSGRRDPDSDMAEGMSATKMRTAASSGKFTDFKRGIPRRMTMADSKRLFNEVRKGMGLPPIREEVILPTSQLREDYVAKKIFNVGAVVEDADGVYEVMDRGANYISVSDEDGNVSKKWLHEVRQIAETNTVNDYHYNDELVFKGFTTEHFHNYYEIKDKFLDLFESDKDPVAVLTCLKLVDQSLKILEEAKSRGYALMEEVGADSIIKMKLSDSLNNIGELERHDYLDQINADLADLLSKEPNMRKDLEEQKNLKIDPQNKFRFTSADRIKVARIIAGSMGVDNPEKMSNPTQLINFGLRKLRTKRVTPEFAEIVKKMLQTAKTAGIDYDRQYLPAIMRQGKFAVENKSFKDFMSEVSGSGVDPIVLQLRKNINLKGNYTFEFNDGSKGKMSPGASEGILNKYDSLRRPAQKLNVSRGMGKSMKSLKDTLSNWDSVANKEDPKAKKSGRDEPLRGVKNPMDEADQYYKGVSSKDKKARKAEFEKDSKKDDSDPTKYDPAAGDLDKKGDFKKTKKSKHTLKYHKKYGDPEEQNEAWLKTIEDLTAFWDEDVKATKERIKKEKEADKMKHDKMMDRARTQDAQKKNRETKPGVKKEESEGKDGIMGVGKNVTRKVRQGLRAELMMRMAMTKKKMAKADKGSKEFDELYAEYKKCKDRMKNLPGVEGANEQKIWEVKRPSVDEVDPSSNFNIAKSIMSYQDYKKMLKLAGGIEKRKVDGTMEVDSKATRDEKIMKQVIDEDWLEENTAVAKKAKKSGIPKGILMQVYKRGMAAYGTGHRPGASQQQWALARVNSFIGKGKGTWGKADKDLADKARSAMSDEVEPNKKKKKGDVELKEQKKNCGCGKDPCETYGDIPEEKEMTDAQMKKREDIVKGMKDKTADFKKRYGKDYKDVMYATATKMAMKEEADGEPMTKIEIDKPVETEDKPKADKIKKKSGTPKSDDPYDLEVFVADPKADAMLDDLNDDEIENVVNMFDPEQDPINGKLDIFDLYDDEELALEVEDEEGEVTQENFEYLEGDLEQQLNEVLSRTERIKNRVRVRRTKARRARSLRIALRRHSSTQVINSRARRLAVKLLKRRFFKKAPNQLSVGERERAEARIAKMRHVVKRIALKLAPRVRQMEKKRLHGRKSVKPAQKFKSALAGGRIRTAKKQTGRKTVGNYVGQRSKSKKGYGGATGKAYGGVRKK